MSTRYVLFYNYEINESTKESLSEFRLYLLGEDQTFDPGNNRSPIILEIKERIPEFPYIGKYESNDLDEISKRIDSLIKVENPNYTKRLRFTSYLIDTNVDIDTEFIDDSLTVTLLDNYKRVYIDTDLIIRLSGLKLEKIEELTFFKLNIKLENANFLKINKIDGKYLTLTSDKASELIIDIERDGKNTINVLNTADQIALTFIHNNVKFMRRIYLSISELNLSGNYNTDLELKPLAIKKFNDINIATFKVSDRVLKRNICTFDRVNNLNLGNYTRNIVNRADGPEIVCLNVDSINLTNAKINMSHIIKAEFVNFPNNYFTFFRIEGKEKETEVYIKGFNLNCSSETVFTLTNNRESLSTSINLYRSSLKSSGRINLASIMLGEIIIDNTTIETKTLQIENVDEASLLNSNFYIEEEIGLDRINNLLIKNSSFKTNKINGTFAPNTINFGIPDLNEEFLSATEILIQASRFDLTGVNNSFIMKPVQAGSSINMEGTTINANYVEISTFNLYMTLMSMRTTDLNLVAIASGNLDSMFVTMEMAKKVTFSGFFQANTVAFEEILRKKNRFIIILDYDKTYLNPQKSSRYIFEGWNITTPNIIDLNAARFNDPKYLEYEIKSDSKINEIIREG